MKIDCHQCGQCCIEISISSAIPGMPEGKPAGVACKWLDKQSMLCKLFKRPERPQICSSFNANSDICGKNGNEAVKLIRMYEAITKPC